jgi:fructose-bisphosphate aldolase class 1
MTMRKRAMSRPVDGLVRLTPRYSGRNSHGFWRRVNALKGKDWEAAYSMGCALQNHEHTVLQFINAKPNAEAHVSATKEPIA